MSAASYHLVQPFVVDSCSQNGSRSPPGRTGKSQTSVATARVGAGILKKKGSTTLASGYYNHNSSNHKSHTKSSSSGSSTNGCSGSGADLSSIADAAKSVLVQNSGKKIPLMVDSGSTNGDSSNFKSKMSVNGSDSHEDSVGFHLKRSVSATSNGSRKSSVSFNDAIYMEPIVVSPIPGSTVHSPSARISYGDAPYVEGLKELSSDSKVSRSLYSDTEEEIGGHRLDEEEEVESGFTSDISSATVGDEIITDTEEEDMGEVKAKDGTSGTENNRSLVFGGRFVQGGSSGVPSTSGSGAGILIGNVCNNVAKSAQVCEGGEGGSLAEEEASTASTFAWQRYLKNGKNMNNSEYYRDLPLKSGKKGTHRMAAPKSLSKDEQFSSEEEDGAGYYKELARKKCERSNDLYFRLAEKTRQLEDMALLYFTNVLVTFKMHHIDVVNADVAQAEDDMLDVECRWFVKEEEVESTRQNVLSMCERKAVLYEVFNTTFSTTDLFRECFLVEQIQPGKWYNWLSEKLKKLISDRNNGVNREWLAKKSSRRLKAN
eukprot:Nk52_evm7s77 gene=Nk52_evmTU7s77